MVMAETLCDWSKREIMERRQELLILTRDATFFCRKCARVSNRPRVLCKPGRFFIKGEEPLPQETK